MTLKRALPAFALVAFGSVVVAAVVGAAAHKPASARAEKIANYYNNNAADICVHHKFIAEKPATKKTLTPKDNMPRIKECEKAKGEKSAFFRKHTIEVEPAMRKARTIIRPAT